MREASLLSLSENTQSDVIEAFNSTSRYLDDLLNIDNSLVCCLVIRGLTGGFLLLQYFTGWSGGAMVLSKLPVLGRPTI